MNERRHEERRRNDESFIRQALRKLTDRELYALRRAVREGEAGGHIQFQLEERREFVRLALEIDWLRAEDRP